MTQHQTVKLAVVPGDGIGQEVVPEGLKVLAAALEGTGVGVAITDFDLGADRWHRTSSLASELKLYCVFATQTGKPSKPSRETH